MRSGSTRIPPWRVQVLSGETASQAQASEDDNEEPDDNDSEVGASHDPALRLVGRGMTGQCSAVKQVLSRKISSQVQASERGA